ncbi:hypothetical protein H8B09_29790 [Paenibacillus sp. PR3]|uniref:Uncharacterized protein n=1 Tax=Paenibacillus terricola TaxID=2763503 RepID=A0ABR8N438_9BACL|nr:hypothetical protein [Paenibacillus terricola]MBD3922937.1 hypothetical protein [Paenibacillus terricola]
MRGRVTLVNSLSVEMLKSKYASVEHPTILIDGIALDIYLHSLYPNDLYLGIIPTITDWIDLKDEAKFVLSRFQSNHERVILPILMCPDDCDLTCTVIVAEVINRDNEVVWCRIGVDASKLGIPYNYERIGTDVNWLELVPEMIFDKTSYFENMKHVYRPINE